MLMTEPDSFSFARAMAEMMGGRKTRMMPMTPGTM